MGGLELYCHGYSKVGSDPGGVIAMHEKQAVGHDVRVI